MNTDIAKMLKYQEVDMRLYRLDKKLKNAEETKKWLDATQKKKEFRDDYVNVDRDMTSEMASITKASEDFNALMAEVNDLESMITDKSSIDEIDYFLKKIDDIMKKIKDVETIATDSKKALERLTEVADNDLKQIVKCNQIIAEFKPAVEKLKAEIMKEAAKVKAELDKVIKEEKIDTEGEVYKVYKAKSKHKMPVFVEMDGNSCCGCGVEIPQRVGDIAGSKGYAECPNCGRIMYVK